MTPEIRFFALVIALLMLWAASSLVRESTEPTSATVIAASGLTQPSDARLKQQVQDLPYGLPELLSLRPVSYRYKAFPSQPHIGFIAQEVASVVPEVVSMAPENPESLDPRYYRLNYGELVPVLVRAVQEQQQTITSLEARIRALEAPMTQ